MTERGPLAGAPLLGLLTLALGLAAAARLPVALDEAYYWTWSKDLAWSYYDHPPLVAAAIAGARSVFGEGLLALRAVSVVSALLCVGFIRAAAREAAAPAARTEAGRAAVLLSAAALMLVVGYLPATPDPLQGAALAAAAWAVGRGLRGVRWARGLAAFLLTAGALAKHSSALVAAGALLGALTHAEARRALLRPETLVGALLGGAALAPWLVADLQHADGATAFQAARVAFGRAPRGALAVPLTLGALALTVGPGGAVGLLAALRDRADPAVRVWTFGAVALVLGCVAAAWLGSGEINWLMPAFAFGGPAAAGWLSTLGVRPRRALVTLSGLAGAMNLVVLLHIVYPFAPIAPRKDRTLRAAGFEGVAEVVKDVAKAHGAKVLVTRGYQAASQLRFHLQDGWPVLETASRRRSQYDRWPRPAVCPGDVVVLAWGRTDLPEGLEATPLGPMIRAPRSRAGRARDPFFVHPLRVTGRGLCPGDAR